MANVPDLTPILDGHPVAIAPIPYAGNPESDVEQMLAEIGELPSLDQIPTAPMDVSDVDDAETHFLIASALLYRVKAETNQTVRDNVSRWVNENLNARDALFYHRALTR